ncbi:unnamed protein product [Rotaria sp. Silwood1]|nr:unnamed protein product [Rotaria sp. Silwood1]
MNKLKEEKNKAQQEDTHKYFQKKNDVEKKTLLAVEKAHIARGEVIEKYEKNLLEIERLRREYEDKLQNEST